LARPDDDLNARERVKAYAYNFKKLEVKINADADDSEATNE
jgi:hypothetical protein